ncbi:MAG: carbon starvation CstA family protein, partial [Candidatus Zixiibacteriota bacterium]
IWLHLLMIVSSNSFALIITLQGNVWTFEPQLSYLEINCCTSNVNPPPANSRNDSKDFVPTRTHILFAHHFSTIAGAGPIIGPTIGILYGFAPAWIWIVPGTVFFGAVHDYSTLFASIREGGKSIGEIAGISLGKTGMFLFLAFTLIMIFLVTSAFLSMTAISLTSMWPLSKLSLETGQTLLKTTEVNGQPMGIIGGIASTSVIIITIFSPLLGFLMCRKSMKMVPGYFLAAIVCALSIIIGFNYPINLPPTAWMIIISIYVLFAAGAPVWVILQPRDFTNVQILYGGMAALVISIIIGGFSGLTISFPAFSLSAGIEHLGFIWPMLMITIACGAISGFHSLVASGTSSKQVRNESSARKIGFGGMVLEGALAVLVLLALASSLGYSDYLNIVWPDSGSNPVLAFALAVGGLMNGSLGIPISVGAVMGILLIEGFVVTTLDSAVRLNRYLFEEFWSLIFDPVPSLLRKFWFNSGISVIIMFLLAYFNAFRLIWPLFGTANQLMAALALIAVSAWLFRKGRKNWFTLIPAVFMVITTVASLIYLLIMTYLPSGNIVLIIADLILLALSFGVVAISLQSVAGRIRQINGI